jgi:hypothetical protein
MQGLQPGNIWLGRKNKVGSSASWSLIRKNETQMMPEEGAGRNAEMLS